MNTRLCFAGAECRRLVVRLLLFVFILPASWLSAQPSTVVEYAQLEHLIREKNGLVASSLEMTHSARARTGYLERSFLPQLILSLGGETFRTGTESLRTEPFAAADLSVNLYRGGRDVYEDSIRDAQADVAQAQSRLVYLAELEEAQALYWDIVSLTELAARTRAVSALNENALKSAQQRVRRGLLSPTDVKGFELYRGLLEEQLHSLEHEEVLVMIQLKAILGFSPTESITLAEEKVPYDPNDPLLRKELAITRHPQLTELTLSRHIAELQKEKWTSQTHPSVDLFALYSLYTFRERSFDNLNHRTDIAGGIRIEWPIFDGHQSEAEAEAAEYRIRSLIRLIDHRQRRLTALSATTQEELRHLDDLIRRSGIRVRQTQAFLTGMLDDYDRGVKTASDVLTAIEMYQTTLVDDVHRRRDYQKTRVRLNALSMPVIPEEEIYPK